MIDHVIEQRDKYNKATKYGPWHLCQPPSIESGFYRHIEALIMEQLPAGSIITVERGHSGQTTTQYRQRDQ